MQPELIFNRSEGKVIVCILCTGLSVTVDLPGVKEKHQGTTLASVVSVKWGVEKREVPGEKW